jgi:hypothetical protein
MVQYAPPGDTSASTAIALTRAALEAVARTSAATAVTLAWLTGVARTSAAIEVTRLAAISGHDLRPDLQGVDAAAVSGSVSWMSRKWR